MARICTEDQGENLAGTQSGWTYPFYWHRRAVTEVLQELKVEVQSHGRRDCNVVGGLQSVQQQVVCSDLSMRVIHWAIIVDVDPQFAKLQTTQLAQPPQV